MKDKTMKDLRAQATAEGITVPFGTSKEELQKLLSNGEQPTQEAPNKVPKDLDYLKLADVVKFTKEDVNINHFAGRRKLLDIPSYLKEDLIREGYKLIFPLDDKNSIDDLRRLRGAEFVLDTDGSAIRVSAKQSNAKGELQFHIAMKIKKEFLEEETRQHQKKYLSKKDKIRNGDDGVNLSTDPSLMKFTNHNNKI